MGLIRHPFPQATFLHKCSGHLRTANHQTQNFSAKPERLAATRELGTGQRVRGFPTVRRRNHRQHSWRKPDRCRCSGGHIPYSANSARSFLYIKQANTPLAGLDDRILRYDNDLSVGRLVRLILRTGLELLAGFRRILRFERAPLTN